MADSEAHTRASGSVATHVIMMLFMLSMCAPEELGGVGAKIQKGYEKEYLREGK